MTKQEVLIDYIRDIYPNDDFKNSFDDCVKLLKEYANQPKWIPVSERLPTKDDANEKGDVLVQYKNGQLNIVHYSLVDKMIMFNHTAWQLLPEPFKE
jgi:hypothetical protein